MSTPTPNPPAGSSGSAVLVTGGAKRIGAAICRTIARRGHRVIVHANTSIEEAEQLAQELDGHAIQADLSDPDQADALAGQARDLAAEPLHHVVNNASAFPRQRLDTTTAVDLDTMMHLHAYAPLTLVRDIARHGGKSAVNLLDTHIGGHDPAHFPYLQSKKALHALTLDLAHELAPFRVNAVAPGPILAPTDGTDETTAAKHLQRAVDATLLGRAGTPEEVAASVDHLLHAEYVTGNVVYVDGGRHLRT